MPSTTSNQPIKSLEDVMIDLALRILDEKTALSYYLFGPTVLSIKDIEDLWEDAYTAAEFWIENCGTTFTLSGQEEYQPWNVQVQAVRPPIINDGSGLHYEELFAREGASMGILHAYDQTLHTSHDMVDALNIMSDCALVTFGSEEEEADRLEAIASYGHYQFFVSLYQQVNFFPV